jgi:hypothetical protein
MLTWRRPLALAVAALAATAALHAQQRTAASGPPDWSGLYRPARGAALAGFTPLAPDLDALIMSRLQPWARDRIEQTNGVAFDFGAVCQLTGLFRHPSTVGGFYWLPGADKIVMPSTALFQAGVRRIYLTDRHPKRLPPTWLGHSIGHWEGQTLVVDTIGLNDKSWLMSGMEPHTEELHVVERIREAAPGLLEFVTTVDDPKALTAPYTYSRYYRKTDGEWEESICNGDPDEARLWNDFRKSATRNPPPPRQTPTETSR